MRLMGFSHLVGWLVIEVEHLYSALKQSINAVPARALSRTNHIYAEKKFSHSLAAQPNKTSHSLAAPHLKVSH